MSVSTPLCDRLDVEYPIVQAPIGSATRPELAAAVPEAGGLGTLALTWRPPDRAAEFVERTLATTDQPFAVNLVLDPEARDVPVADQLAAVLEAGVPPVSFSFGDAAPYIERVRDAGAAALVIVGSAAEVEAAEAAGADVVAQGWEAGGHVQSEVATLPLVPRIADAVDVPVVAAGGIADGRGIAAVLAAGADGTWVGTRVLATEEAAVADVYRKQVLEADETDTLHSELFDVGWEGMPHRALRNSTVESWAAAGRPEPGERPGEGETIAEYPGGQPIERYGDDLPVEGAEGDLEALAPYAGQSSGLTEEVRPAAACSRNWSRRRKPGSNTSPGWSGSESRRASQASASERSERAVWFERRLRRLSSSRKTALCAVFRTTPATSGGLRDHRGRRRICERRTERAASNESPAEVFSQVFATERCPQRDPAGRAMTPEGIKRGF